MSTLFLTLYNSSMKKYDVIVIGAGSAGLGSSGVANVLGLKTLLIEKNNDNFGGDCTNFGCVPSKALIHIANQFYQAKSAERFGLQFTGKADMGSILDHIHQMQKVIKDTEDAKALRKKGIDVVIGKAAFESKDTLKVNNETYSARVILLCTGSLPRKLDVEGIDSVKVYTNETIFFDCRKLPENFVVIGGGPIGCELGQAFSRLGSKVTIVNQGDRLLDKEPKNISEILETRFKAEGIQILNGAQVRIFKDGKAHITSKEKEGLEIACDAVLVSVGRTVNTNGMNFETAGIALTKKGKIKVDEYLQTTNKKVYVIGDAAGSYMFSHGAEKMVRQLWRNLLIPIFKKKNSWNDLSWVTFTDPQVAHFGLTEEKLLEQGIKYHRQNQSFEHDDRAIVEEYTYGSISLWFNDNDTIGNKKIISGSMIAPRAGELVQELELAKHAGIPISKLNNRVYPYPVAARINQKTIRGVMEQTRSDWKLRLARTAFRWFHS
ncbi:MAG TPA: NAD(P)/FAD-dependent oxidoreductase [Pricia antarctica]|uniref:NAD(P)/FAD-dependent oxidoreductase n=1 Tax=Pricia antarctica TaxID=641691 RepID=A0A831QNC7_9FLAO|nr:NAD(P)/FAD-dependent oxidoreductase [Pricia antarctica]